MDIPPKKIAILGSTGSIGKNTLRVARHLKNAIEVVALSAHSNIDLLEEQARLFNPKIIGVFDSNKALELQKRLPLVKIVSGMEGLMEVASFDGVDLVVSAMSGFCGVLPTVAGIKAKKDIALACKEVLVSAGEYVMGLAKKYGVRILPIDSEHCSLFQSLENTKEKEIKRLIITASGGPFKDYTADQLESITPSEALKHPTWNMGPKNTIDSSTLMNKGLEVIEAYWLFQIPIERIEVLIHPQSIVHAILEYIDGYTVLNASPTSMTFPIQYALTYPKRVFSFIPHLDYTKGLQLEFHPTDPVRFPCLDMAIHCLKEGGTLPCFMNAANEILVKRFLGGRISWLDISKKLEKLINNHTSNKGCTLETLIQVDNQARRVAERA